MNTTGTKRDTGAGGGDHPWSPPRDTFVVGVVDDDPAVGTLLARLFPRLLTVEQATRINDAVGLISRAAPLDMVLVDGQIPWSRHDGATVVGLLRGAGYTGPILAISDDAVARIDTVRADPLGLTSEFPKVGLPLLDDVIAAGLPRAGTDATR